MAGLAVLAGCKARIVGKMRALCMRSAQRLSWGKPSNIMDCPFGATIRSDDAGVTLPLSKPSASNSLRAYLSIV